MGTDEFGNRYFENLDYPETQSRWVLYKKSSFLEQKDGSQVPPAWQGWLLKMTDQIPGDGGITSNKHDFVKECVCSSNVYICSNVYYSSNY